MPNSPAPTDSAPLNPKTGKLLREGEDYYYEGSKLVFTAQYHLDRGECCGSGCRHCPFGNEPGDQ